MKILFTITLTLFSLGVFSQNAIHYKKLFDTIEINPICQNKADTIFKIFTESPCFDWSDRKNNCEDRANAIALILDKWKISNGKIWLFGGKNAKYGDKKGTLKGWSYHVASCIFTSKNNKIDTLIIDPLTNSNKLLTIKEWTNLITKSPTNIYFLTRNDKYQQENISLNPKWKYSRDYFETTIEGLTGYNNYSFWTRLKTKKYLKRNLKKVKKEFNMLYETDLDRIDIEKYY